MFMPLHTCCLKKLYEPRDSGSMVSVAIEKNP